MVVLSTTIQLQRKIHGLFLLPSVHLLLLHPLLLLPRNSVRCILLNASEVALPPGWEEGYDRASGRVYFINHIEKKTSWTHPVTGQTKMIQQPVTASLPLQPNYGSAPPATQNAYPPHLSQSMAHTAQPSMMGRPAPLTMGAVPPVGASSHVANQFAQQQTISLSVAKPQWNTEQETNHCFKCNAEIGGFFKRKRVSLSWISFHTGPRIVGANLTLWPGPLSLLLH